MLKKNIAISLFSFVFILLLLSCDDDDNVTEPGATFINTEQWEAIIDDGEGSANWEFKMKSDSTVIVEGEWIYSYAGSDVSCPISEGEATIWDSNFSYDATGTANNPSAPSGYRDSDFDLSVDGTTGDGEGDGSYVITFSQTGWPNQISGIWEGNRTSGSGITE